MTSRIEKICIVGAGSAGFLSAVTLKQLLPTVNVQLVYSSKLPITGVGESTTELFPRFLHQQLRLDPKSFFREVRPSWKLGVRFEWGDPNDSRFNYGFQHVYSSQIPSLPRRGGHYCVTQRNDESYVCAAMDRNLSPLLNVDGQLQFLPSSGYHLPNAPFLNYMKRVAEELGVTLVDAEVKDVRTDSSGNVADLLLEDGSNVSADLFVDCTGFRSLLLSKTLKEKFVDYSDTLFCDRALVGSWKREGEIRPYTTAETMDNGWCWRIEFEDVVTRGYVYSSNFCSDDEARRELLRKNPELTDELRLLKFPSGRYENYWSKNVLAIGNSSGFVEPLEATALHLIAVQLSAFSASIIESNFRVVPAVRDSLNQQYRTMWDDVRDFLAIHYKFNRRSDSEFWKHCRRETPLGTAAGIVEFFREAGPHRLGEGLIPRESMFQYEGYLAMLLGQRVPTKYDAQLTSDETRDWNQHRQRVRAVVSNAMPIREALEFVHNPKFQWPNS